MNCETISRSNVIILIKGVQCRAVLMHIPYSLLAWIACQWSGWMDGVWCNFPSCWDDSDTETSEGLGLLPASPSCHRGSDSASAEGEVQAAHGTEAQKGRTPGKKNRVFSFLWQTGPHGSMESCCYIVMVLQVSIFNSNLWMLVEQLAHKGRSTACGCQNKDVCSFTGIRRGDRGSGERVRKSLITRLIGGLLLLLAHLRGTLVAAVDSVVHGAKS